MADSIDELKIEIEAEASNASDSITGLVNELTSLNNIVSKLDTSKLTSLATSLQNLGNIKFGNTTSELQKLDSQIDKVTSDASKNLSDKLIDAFNISDREAKKSVNSMSKSYMQLNKEFAFDTSIDNVQKLTDALKELQDVAKSGARGEVYETELKDFYDEWKVIGQKNSNIRPLYVDDNIKSDRGIDQWNADLDNYVGKLSDTLSKAGDSIDIFYREMSGKYPTLFPQDIILPISQYEQILGTVERYKAALKDTKTITEEWGMSLDEIVQKLASETSNDVRYQYQDILGTENASGASLKSAYAQIQAESKAAEEANQGSFQGTIDSITRLTDAIKSIPKDDRLGQFAIDLEKLTEVTSKLSGVSDVADGLTKLVTVAANFPKKAVFNDFITSLRLLNDTAEYKNLDDIANYIDRLSESMMKFSEMRSYRLILDTGESVATAPPANESDVKTTEELSEANRDLSSSAEEATQAVNGLKEAIDNQNESQESGISSTNGIKENLDETADAEKKAGQSAQETEENVYTLGDAFKNVQSSVKSFCSAVIDVGKEVVNADFSMIGAVLNEAAEGAQALGSGALDASKNIAKLILQSTPIAKIGDSFDALGRSSDKLSREISRLTRMFSNLVLRTAMRSVIGDLDTSFQHLAQESSNVNEKVSSLMSSLSQLSHSIASLAEPILDIVGPALEYLISMLNTAITYVNQFLAALTGKTYVTGSYVASDYADSISTLAASAEDAADAEAKLNKQLQGFNELNNLTTTETSSGSGSGGSGTSGGGYEGGYFEDLDVSQDIQDFVDKLLEAWENSDFTEIGNILGEKLKEALESIPWDEIQYYAWKIAHSLATLINGFIETEGLGETIGNTLGEAINTALIFADTILETLHWDNLGIFLADIVNGAIESVNWELLGITLGDAITAWLEYGFNFITHIEWSELGEDIALAVNDFVDLVNDALTNADYNWQEVGSGFAEGLASAFTDIHWDDIGVMVGNGINVVLDNIAGFVRDFPYEELGSDLAEAMNNAFATIHWDEIGTTIKNGINGIFSSVGTWAAEFDFESLGEDVATAINKALNGIEWSDAITAATNIGTGIAKALNNVLTAETFENLGSTIAGALNTAIAGVGAFLDDTNFKEVGQAVAAGFNKWMADMDFEELGRTLGGVVQSALDFLSGFINDGGVDWGAVKDALQELWNGICEEIHWDEAGPIIVTALGVWLAGNLVSGVLSAMGTAVTLSFASSIASALGGGITAVGLGAVVEALGGALAVALGVAGIAYLISVVDWEGIGNAIADKLAETLGSVETTIHLVFNPDEGFVQEIYESLDDEMKKYYVHANVVAEVEKVVNNLEDDEIVFAAVGEIMRICEATGLDTSDIVIDDLVAYVRQLVAENDDLTIEDVVAAIGEYIYNGGDVKLDSTGEINAFEIGPDLQKGDRPTTEVNALIEELFWDLQSGTPTLEVVGEIYELLLGRTASNATITGLTGIIENLKTEGYYSIENIEAVVTLYGYLEDLYDDLTDDERKVAILAKIEEIIKGSGVQEVDGLKGEIEDIINNCNDPLDAVAQIYDYLIKNNLLPEVDGILDATEFKDEMNRGEKTAEDGTLEAENLEDNIPENQKHPEIEPSIAGLSYSKDLSIDATAHITNLTQEQKMELFGEITKVIDGTSGDNYVDSIGNIIKIITGKDATTEQINGLTGVIEDLKNNGNLTVDNVTAAILSFLYPDEVTVDTTGNMTGVNTPSKPFDVDAEGNIVDIDYNNTFGVDVDGNMKDLDVPNSLKNIQGMTGYISQALSSGQLSVSDVRAMVSQAVANGQLSMSDVRALVDSVEAQTGVSLTTGVRANSIDANGQSVATMIRANSFDNNGKSATAPILAASFNNNGKNATAAIYASSFNNNGKHANAAVYASEFNRNGKSATAPILAASLSNNGKSATAPILAASFDSNNKHVSAAIYASDFNDNKKIAYAKLYASEISSNNKNATTKILASAFENNGKNATTKVLASSFDNNGKNATTKILASAFDNNGKNATTKILASAFDNNGKNATTKVLASAFDNNGKNATTKVLASAFDNNGKNATTKVLASSFDNNGKNATTKVLASSFDNNGKNATTKVLASSFDNNGKNATTKVLASSFDNNGKNVTTKILASSFSNNGNKFTTTFYASSLNKNGNTFSTTFYASSLNRNGNTFSTTFYASSLSRNGHTFSTTFYASSLNRNGNTVSAPIYASSLNKNGCSITLTGTVSTSGTRATIRLAKKGGVFSDGRWSDIPQYAGGTVNAGSLFIAGEAGPEIVGHIGSRTEVLNASQLASVMRDSVVEGIAGIASYLNAIHSQMMTNANGIINAIVVCTGTPQVMPSAYAGSGTIDARFEQMQEDTDQVIGLLSDIEENTRDIGTIDISTDPDNMFTAMRKKNREYILKTGKSAFDY